MRLSAATVLALLLSYSSAAGPQSTRVSISNALPRRDTAGRLMDVDVSTAGRLKSDDDSAATRLASAVAITSEAAMRDKRGDPIRDCLMPHIVQLAGMWYAYGFGIPANATGDQRYNTCYSSPDLAVWTHRACPGLPGLYVVHNAKTNLFVSLGEDYSKSIAFYTSPTPLGPFTKRPDTQPVYGDPGDAALFVDDSDGGKAYLIYNRYSGPIHQRFAYIYQLNDDYTDIIPSTLTNTSRVMEGLWMVKRHDTCVDCDAYVAISSLS